MPIASPNPLYLRDAELDQGIALLQSALDALTAESDRLLAERGLGRGHHRALALIGHHPGITMAELQGVLPLTKQSLSRLLKQLVEQGLVEQRPGRRDRRERPLGLTEPGRELCERLNRLQRRRLATAYRNGGAEAVAGFREVLRGLVGGDAAGGRSGGGDTAAVERHHHPDHQRHRAAG